MFELWNTKIRWISGIQKHAIWYNQMVLFQPFKDIESIPVCGDRMRSQFPGYVRHCQSWALANNKHIEVVSWLLLKKLKKVVGCCQITSNYYVSLGIAIVHFIHQTSDSKPLTLLNQGVPREATGIWPKYALETVKRWHWHLGPGLEHPSAGFLCCRGMGSLHIAMKRRSMGSIRLKEWIKLWFWCFFWSFAKKF